MMFARKSPMPSTPTSRPGAGHPVRPLLEQPVRQPEPPEGRGSGPGGSLNGRPSRRFELGLPQATRSLAEQPRQLLGCLGGAEQVHGRPGASQTRRAGAAEGLLRAAGLVDVTRLRAACSPGLVVIVTGRGRVIEAHRPSSVTGSTSSSSHGGGEKYKTTPAGNCGLPSPVAASVIYLALRVLGGRIAL